jgi:hypothetical protein
MFRVMTLDVDGAMISLLSRMWGASKSDEEIPEPTGRTRMPVGDRSARSRKLLCR